MNGRGLGTDGRRASARVRRLAARYRVTPYGLNRYGAQGCRVRVSGLAVQLLCRCLSPADPSQTTALAASEEVETDAAVLAAGETEVGAYFRDV